MKNKNHAFAKTIGDGPYTYVGSYSIAVGERGTVISNQSLHDSLAFGGGTCAHCGTGIKNVFVIRVGDGNLYGVGSSCIGKMNMPGEVVAAAKSDKKRRDGIARAERAEKKRVAKFDRKQELLAEHESALKAEPHPNDYFAGKGRTLYDYFDYMRADYIIDHFSNK